MIIEGDVKLTDGSLIGLSKLKRQGPVVMDWQEGAVKLMAGLTIPGLLAPFTGHAQVYKQQSFLELIGSLLLVTGEGHGSRS